MFRVPVKNEGQGVPCTGGKEGRKEGRNKRKEVGEQGEEGSRVSGISALCRADGESSGR